MTPALSTTAWVMHDLGLATNFGGALFGKLALDPAVRAIPNREDRGRVLEAAWKGFNLFNMISLGTVAATWFTGRSMLSGREIDRSTHALVIAKDALVVSTLLTGIGAFASGIVLSRQGYSGLPVEDGYTPSVEMPREAQIAHRATKLFGIANLVGAAGLVAITAVLAMKSSSSHRFGLISRFLP